MISLKQFWDRNGHPNGDGNPPAEWKAAWESLLCAMGESASRALPPLGSELSQKLSELGRNAVSLSGEAPLGGINEAIRIELGRWSDDVSRFCGEQQEELKKILAAVARTAESIGTRDGRYSHDLGNFAARLRTVADQTDLGVIRKSIVESADAVQTCVARMTKEGRETVKQLTAQTEEYRERMEEAERISMADPLTGVLNRRGLDQALAGRIAEGLPFFVIMLDLDRFKSINDSLGHSAGDDLLRQLSAELLTQFPPPRVVARLGGDEFIVITAGDQADADAVAGRMRSWVLGKYRVADSNGSRIEVSVQGSLGSALWNGSEMAEGLLARADKLMYRNKAARLAVTPERRAGEPKMAGAGRF